MNIAPHIIMPLLFLSLSDLSMCEAPLIVAHRGASHDAPENTLAAFELAWEQGADAIETDLHLTRDGEIICIHNETTQAVSDKKLIVAQSTLEKLQQLDVGSWFGKRWKGTNIPTLADVLQTVPEGKRIFLEIKCGQEILPKLFEELQNTHLLPEQAVILSFQAEVIFAIKQTAPEIKAFILSGFEKNQLSRHVKPNIENVLEILRLTHADGFSSKAHKSVKKSFVRRILDEGYEYHVWTIDNVRTARKFQEYGAVSITTNRPGYLKKKIL